MSGALDKFGISRLNVTHVSQQFWCERQVALSLEHPREETEEMAAGTELHRELMLELVKEVSAETSTIEDEVYLIMLNLRTGLEQLVSEGKTRELRVFGRAGEFPLSGIIDELSLTDGELTILDHKTRTKPSLPPPPTFATAEIQVMLYRKLLDDLRHGKYGLDQFIVDRGLTGLGEISPGMKEQLEAQGLYEGLTPVELSGQVFAAFRELPALSDYLIVRYLHRDSGHHIGDKVVLHDPAIIEKRLHHALKFWNGEREAITVKGRERWKCNYCEYRGVHCNI
ncbi:PD-(D/E)XK nuclease family protein [Methanocella sp. MCL-LM]|uniref:PD-(D/E)XK nuclease family protein n=1 Tax=Methanocella sp. MCL-LM TaxID=3412035 RepID=UPI003C722901